MDRSQDKLGWTTLRPYLLLFLTAVTGFPLEKRSLDNDDSNNNEKLLRIYSAHYPGSHVACLLLRTAFGAGAEGPQDLAQSHSLRSHRWHLSLIGVVLTPHRLLQHRETRFITQGGR